MALAIVIVPASFTPPGVYSPFETALQSLGFKTVTVDLPSVGTRDSGKFPGSMADDANEVSHVVKDLYDNSSVEEVVLFAHSYGGIPASESMKETSEKNRAPQGKKGVSRIVYFAAIVLPVGVSNHEMRKRPVPDYVKIEVRLNEKALGEMADTFQHDWITIDHARDAPYSFSDMPVVEGLALAAQMQQQSAASFAERATYAGYNDVEVLYVQCMEDETLPPEGTKRILGVIGESCGTTPRVYQFAGGHCSMMSKPEQCARLVKDILIGK